MPRTSPKLQNRPPPPPATLPINTPHENIAHNDISTLPEPPCFERERRGPERGRRARYEPTCPPSHGDGLEMRMNAACCYDPRPLGVFGAFRGVGAARGARTLAPRSTRPVRNNMSALA